MIQSPVHHDRRRPNLLLATLCDSLANSPNCPIETFQLEDKAEIFEKSYNHLLVENTTLRHIKLVNFGFNLNSDVVNHPTLKRIDFRTNGQLGPMPDHSYQNLILLVSSPQWKTEYLNLDGHHLSKEQFTKVLRCVGDNKTLKSISLKCNCVEMHNSSPNEFYAALEYIFTQNKTLLALTIPLVGRGKHRPNYLKEMIKVLKTNITLLTLHVTEMMVGVRYNDPDKIRTKCQDLVRTQRHNLFTLVKLYKY